MSFRGLFCQVGCRLIFGLLVGPLMAVGLVVGGASITVGWRLLVGLIVVTLLVVGDSLIMVGRIIGSVMRVSEGSLHKRTPLCSAVTHACKASRLDVVAITCINSEQEISAVAPGTWVPYTPTLHLWVPRHLRDVFRRQRRVSDDCSSSSRKMR